MPTPKNKNTNNNDSISSSSSSSSLILFLRLAYFTMFLARGSLFPFLGVILRARGSSLLLIGIALNVSAIARLVVSYVFASILMMKNNTNTSHQNSNNHSSSSIDLLRRILNICIFVAVIAVCVFTTSPSNPSLSAVAAATALSASSIGSLVLDSLTIKMFDDEKELQHHTQNSDDDEKSSSSSAVIVSGNEKEKEAKADDDDDGSDASVGFGNVRLFGSLGWGIAAPCQVLLMKLLYDRGSENDDVIKFAQSDFGVWFKTNHTSVLSLSNTSKEPSSPLYGTPLIFLLAIACFAAVLQMLPSRLPVHRHRHQHIDEDVNSTEMTVDVDDDKDNDNNDEDGKDEDNQEEKHTTSNRHEKKELSFSSLVWSLRFALLLATLYGLCDDIVGTYLFPFLRNDLHASSFLISIIPTVNVLSELPVLHLSGWFRRTFSIYTLHMVFLTLWTVRFCWYSFVLVAGENTGMNNETNTETKNQNTSSSSSLSSLMPLNFKILIVETLNGLCFAGALVLCMRHVVSISKEELGIDVQSTIPLVHASFFGVSSAIGGAIGGLLAERFGVRVVFTLVAMICLVVVMVIGVGSKLVGMFGSSVKGRRHSTLSSRRRTKTQQDEI